MEYLEKRWKCDFCGRDVKRGVMPPSGWQEIRVDFYGNQIHCCADNACLMKLPVFCRMNVAEEYWPMDVSTESVNSVPP